MQLCLTQPGAGGLVSFVHSSGSSTSVQNSAWLPGVNHFSGLWKQPPTRQADVPTFDHQMAAKESESQWQAGF